MRKPPGAVRWLASCVLPRRDRESILDDLDEDFSRRPKHRHFYYLAQAVHLRLTTRRASSRPHILPHERGPMFATIWQDIRYGLRTLRGQPGFTAVAILSLAVGIGINSTIFAVVDNLLFRPLPFERPDTLVAVYTSDEAQSEFGSTSYPDLIDLSAQGSPFEQLIGHAMMFAAVSVEGTNRLAFGEVVTANYFSALGVRPVVGRGFSDDEGRGEGGHAVAVISERLWRTGFGARADITGATIRIKNRPYTVIGVAPAAFNGMMPGISAELWIPISMVDDVEPAGQIDVVPSATGTTRLQQRGNRWMFVKARLRSGVSVTQAQADAATVMARLERDYPVSNRNRRLTVMPAGQVRFHPDVDKNLRPLSAVLMGAVGLVLLIACANLANMLLARGVSRTKEMALRSALGAGRGRLIRQMVMESLLLSTAGGVLGLALAIWATSLLLRVQLPLELPLSLDLKIDWRLAAFAAGASVITGLLFGVWPALRASRPELVAALKDATPKASGRRFGLRQGLVVLQVAVSVVLLVGGLLLTRSVWAAVDTNPGFKTRGLVSATVSMDMLGYTETQSKLFFERAIALTRGLPGVEAVAFTERLPFSPNQQYTTIVVDGKPERAPATGASVDTTRVSAEYFSALGVPIVRGRNFDQRDTPESTRVAVVSEALAQRFFPDGDAVGGRLRLREQSGPIVEIVGIVRDYSILSLGEKPRSIIHFAGSQRVSTSGSLLVRTSGDGPALVSVVERNLRTLEPQLVFLELGTLERMVSTSLLPLSLGASLFGGLSGLAMMLAGIGLYGVIAFNVARRTKEIGIRMALGSTRGQVLRHVLREALSLVVVGTVIGCGLAGLGAQVLSGVLLGVTPFDLVSYAAAATLLMLTATLASVIPARRAASVDPLVALRTT
jgi:predicted permease